ncbi:MULTISPECIES: GH25 family lysozyme [unclassified Lactococcus]|uniref:GH25 family lysozyme n=1 Tax=unclassified Lactococcus TaxID=2643510 RepID=UPI0011C7B974|nr:MULTISPECIES: GH25 family lysozyme [unclassified Lactococcus]MQW23312.1 N-acetylmuramoyl-L-alanine amidase [Lactococcus sp. dk101]TXK38024.1 N-acetylmuramoyl-L-alanine amidase [Lactococcus sp. dk310]TXK49702.1 N-acetylmuramoyl-L-alanine amidase [Lactococcus sp. dk322]
MKNKITKLLLVSSLSCAIFSAQGVLAATTTNHSMGDSFATQLASQTALVPKFARLGDTATSLYNLSSADSTLPRTDVVDIASYQSWMTQADFNSLKAQGVQTVVVKLTEGTYYTNPYAASQIQMAQAAGLNVAVYHYAIFGNTSDQATANAAAVSEADYFAAAAKSLNLPSTTIMIEDAENSSTSGSVWTQATQSFQTELAAQAYSNSKIYTSKTWVTNSYINSTTLGASNIWIAQYLYGNPTVNPTSWGNALTNNSVYGAWQYSSQMYFNGSNTTSNLTNNRLDVSIDYSNFFGVTNSSTSLNNTNGTTSGATTNSSSSNNSSSNSSSTNTTTTTGNSTSTTNNSSSTISYQNIYRLYNSITKEHLYTADANEMATLPKLWSAWTYEGIAWQSPTTSSTPVYRLYSSKSGEHLYTSDTNEVTVLTSMNGWKKEGIAFYSADSTGIPAFRLYNAAAGVGAHFITTSTTERDNLVTYHNWNYEGIAWYVK